MRRNMNGPRWVFLTVIVALAFASWNPTLAGKPQDDNILILDVVADLSTFDLLPSAFGGPFYVGGSLEDPDTGEVLGLFHCWGFMFAGGAVVNQEYDLTGRGKIILAGVEDAGLRAVTGGTGEFRNVRGQASGFDFSEFPPLFPVTFELIGG